MPYPCGTFASQLPLPCTGPADFRLLKEQFCASAYSLLTHPPPPPQGCCLSPQGQVLVLLLLLMQIVCRGLPNFREVSDRPQCFPCLFANTINHFLFLPQLLPPAWVRPTDVNSDHNLFLSTFSC